MSKSKINVKIKILRTDNGTEYVNGAFKSFLDDAGIIHQKSTPYTPEQNGLAERMNRTLVEKARCMLFDAELELELWAEAINTDAHIINRSPSRGLKDQTPEEIWSGKKPNVEYLRVFGSKAMVHIPKQKRQKLDSKLIECIMVGYCDTTKGYRLFNKMTREILISWDVVFIENQKSNEHITEESKNFDHFIVDLDSVKNLTQNDNQDNNIEEKIFLVQCYQ